MPCLVTFGFLLYAACKRFGDIDSGLVCDAEKYPKDICYFFFDIIFFSLLKGLVAILARYNSTFMSAPNSPVPISLPNAKLNSLQNCSYSGIDISGFAARI